MDADEGMIRKAYYKKAKEYHPDKNKNEGSDEMFHRIQQAYQEILTHMNTFSNIKNSFKSKNIHSSLDHFFTTANLTSFKFSSFGSSSSSDSFIQEKKPHKGQNLQTTIKIGFYDSVTGGTKKIQITYPPKLCLACSRQLCPDCETKKAVKLQDRCQSCKNLAKNCTTCLNTGVYCLTKVITVEVPPGVNNETKRIISGQGEEGINGGESGDLTVCFSVEEDPFFKRQGSDCLVEIPLSFPEAILGTIIEVPSIYNEKIKLKVEPGTQNGHIYYLENLGFFDASTQKPGDMLVKIVIENPKDIDIEEQLLLKQLFQKKNFKSKFRCLE